MTTLRIGAADSVADWVRNAAATKKSDGRNSDGEADGGAHSDGFGGIGSDDSDDDITIGSDGDDRAARGDDDRGGWRQ